MKTAINEQHTETFFAAVNAYHPITLPPSLPAQTSPSSAAKTRFAHS